MSYIYLASPYSHPDDAIQEQRYRAALDATAYLLRCRAWVYSPIVHCRPLALAHSLPHDAGFWQEYNFTMIRSAARLLILQIPGWRESKGVSAEFIYARKRLKPTWGLLPIGDDYAEIRLTGEKS